MILIVIIWNVSSKLAQFSCWVEKHRERKQFKDWFHTCCLIVMIAKASFPPGFSAACFRDSAVTCCHLYVCALGT